MTYTWTNKTKTGGVGLTGKIVQKGKDDFPLMYANDLDWANVEVENGVNLNTTDDLLNYIKGGNSAIIGRIDKLELSNAGYEVRCNKSVCYVGDTLNRELVHIYKNGTELDWDGIIADGITLKWPITKPSGAIDLILFTSNGLWLDGTANVAGTYIFEFMKDNVCIASFRFIVLIPTYKSATITVYKSSDTLPLKPVGVSYNFNSNPASINVGESGWSTSTTGLTGTIWFCTGHVNEANPSTVLWNEPCIYLNSKIVNTENEYRVKEVAVYKAARGPYTETVNGTLITYNKVIPATPTTTGCYTFALDPANDSFQAPSGWFTEPEAAIAAYKSNAQNNGFKDNYRVWKSYNSYRITVNKLTDPNTLLLDTLSESGWTSPVEYLNIDKILEDARVQSELIAQTALHHAYDDLELGSDLQTVVDAINVVFAWRIVGDASSTLSSISDKYVELVDDVDTSSTQHSLFTRFNSYRKQNGNYEGNLDMMNNTRDLCVSGYLMKALKFDSIWYDDQEYLNKWVAFIPTTTEIRTQISDLNEDLGELSTAVNAMNPREIRLQVSKGFKKDVTWTEVDVTEWESARTEIDGHSDDEEYDIDYGDTIRHSERTTSSNDWEYMAVPSINDDFINALPADPYDTNHLGGFRYGHYYSVHYGSYSAGDENAGYKYFRCDFPVSTGFLNILADKVNLGVADTQGGKATLLLKVKDGNGTASVVANLIVLDGETIADAIAAKSLNINNTTYLCKDGDVYFGVPTTQSINPDASDKTNLNTGSRSSRFNHDGSGQLCGGNINWTSNGILYVKEAHIGESGSDWLIKTANNLPTIYSKDNSTNQELFITPQYLNAVKNSTTYWAIQRDGYASFAKGRAEFSPTGVFHLGGLPNTQTTSGKQDGYMHFDPAEGTLTIGGKNVVIASDVMALITAGVAGTSEFASIVANAVAGEVDVTGTLNTDDVSMGDGACFFKGTNEAHSPDVLNGHSYGAGTRGAGHLAKGNIWWDADGNLSIGGQLRLKGTSLEWGGSVQYYEFLRHSYSPLTHGTGGEYLYSEPHFKLPDPKEYLGREVFVEVFIDETEMLAIAGDYSSSDLYIGHYVPSFEIESDSEYHKWIRWGGDACTYVSCDIARDPKFYKLGDPDGVYINNGSLGHSIGTTDTSTLSDAFVINGASDHSGDELYEALHGVGGSGQVKCKGLYLIPTPVKWHLIEGCLAQQYNGGNIRLRMRCQAKRLDFTYSGTGLDTDRYYWEIQSTDFMPCFMVGVYAANPQYLYTNPDLHNETKSSFRTTCEDVIAATGLAFDL